MPMSNTQFARNLVWVNGAVPGALLIWDAVHHQLGANPVNFAIRTTGLLSLIFLVGSLLVTPVRQLTGYDEIYPHRRTLGLYAAFYAFAHFFIFFWWDRERSVLGTVHEIIARRYIWFGMTALLIFVPLALTSTQGMIRRLGPRQWKWLHRLVYVAAVGGAVHYLLLNKIVTTQSIVFASLLGVLLVYRDVASHVLAHAAVTQLKASMAKTPTSTKPRFWKGQLRVVRTFDETPDVRTFRLAPADGGTVLPFDYKAGQYLNVALTVDGKPVNRSYTIASTPTRAGSCELTVKREDMGTSSRHLHEAVGVGDLIKLSAPAGKFTFDGRDATSIVMIAGGVGITPLMSKLRYLTDIGWAGEIFFLFSARSERDIIFRQELDYLSQRHANLHLTITLTRASENWNGERGRITPEFLNRVVTDLTKRPVHICGPTEMADATKEMLLLMGVPAGQIAMESFTSSAVAQETMNVAVGANASSMADAPGSSDESLGTSDDVHSVTFSKSGKTIDVPGDQTILEAAEEAAVPIDFDCRSGICGECKTRMISGDVSMETEDALTASDRAAGIILACQARCRQDVTVDA